MTGNRLPVVVEVCVDSVASAVAAERGGATRVELCGGLSEGGVTPSAGTIEMTRAAISIPMHVMIRPRSGDFCYDSNEFETMRRDITLAARLGANGVVFGILDLHGKIDITRTRQLVDLAPPLSVTFHRAFDMTADLARALEDVISTGADRILTSGGEFSSLEGREALAELIKLAHGRIVIMPGGGIGTNNAPSLIDETGAKEIHVGLRTSLPSPMQYRNPRVSMGALQGQEYHRFVVLEENVRELCTTLAKV